jgi:carboxypeptidase PM20D1
MKRLFAMLLRLGLLSVAVFAGILTVNTLSFTSRQIKVSPAALRPAPPGAAERLGRAISYPTVSGTGGLSHAAFVGLDTFLRQAFPRVDSLLELTLVNRFSRVYRWAGRNPKLSPALLMSHLDVVPVERAEDWSAPPFAGLIRDGYIWGRGALDDKVGVMAILEAVEQLLSEDYIPGRDIYLAFGHDEETGGNLGARVIAHRFAAQGLRFEYVLDEGLLIMEDAFPGLDKPLALIGVAEKGYLTLRLSVSLPQGGHSSMPPAANAIGLLSRAVHRLRERPFPARIDGAARELFAFAGPETRFPYRVLFANLWCAEGLVTRVLSNDPAANALVRTTVAPTIIAGGFKDNVLPAEASATVNFRILPGETIASATERTRRVVADSRIAIEAPNPEFNQDPSPVSPAAAFGFQVVQKTTLECFPGVVVAPSLVLGATDSRHFETLSDHVYRFMPLVLRKEDLGRVHGIDERVSVEGYGRAIAFYRRLIENSGE